MEQRKAEMMPLVWQMAHVLGPKKAAPTAGCLGGGMVLTTVGTMSMAQAMDQTTAPTKAHLTVGKMV